MKPDRSRLTSTLLFLALLTLCTSALGEDRVPASNPIQLFEITFDKDGIAHVHALLELPASPETVFTVLTDYAHWARLFADGTTMVSIRRDADGVTTDMYVPRSVMPGRVHLVIRTRTPSHARIEAELVSGDLQRFWRRWDLQPSMSQSATKAELQILLQPRTWAPQWMIRYGIEKELTEHFRRLVAAVQESPH